MDKISKLGQYFENFKDMNGLGQGANNQVIKMIAYYNFDGGIKELNES